MKDTTEKKESIGSKNIHEKEHASGPPIAPNPKTSCKPPPAATNFLLEQNHLYVRD